MAIMSRWLAPAVLAAGLGVAALAPVTARAQSNDLVRVLVDVADVVLRGGTPYYRNSDYGYEDRLTVSRDRYGRPVYYRNVPQDFRNNPPYGYAHDQRSHSNNRQVKCNKHGKCKTTYYDPRHDRSARDDHRYEDRYYSYDRNDRRRDHHDDHHDDD